MRQITTGELQELLRKPGTVIIDSRPVDAYNGWKLQNEARGGHIPGARSLPYKWSHYIDWIEVVRRKGIMPGQKLVVYGYSRQEILRVAEMFNRAGYRDVSVYYSFVDEWSADNGLKLERLPRYRHLVYPGWIKILLEGGTPPDHPGGKTVICHSHYRNPRAYRSGHIPGAVSLDTLQLESPDTWNRRSPEELKKTLEQLGISSETTVILYGKFMNPDNRDQFPGSSAGHLGAIRCAMIMMYAGVNDVRVLNGGFQSWKDAGFDISTLDKEPVPVDDFGTEIPSREELIVDMPRAREMIGASDAELVCVRSYPEYAGEVSGYNYIEKTGRIPGAVFADCGSDAYHMEHYRNFDHTTREYGEISGIWRRSGITPDKHLAFYCGTGWRGSEAWFNAWLMGWPRVSVFDGGWFEWSGDSGNPVEKGIPAPQGA